MAALRHASIQGIIMSIERIRDEGQTLDTPRGKVLGIVDNREICQQVAKSLSAAGIPKVEVLSGDEGVQLLERVEGFFFSDMEQRVLDRHLAELKAGHAVIAIEAPADRVDEVVKIASDAGARRLVHFGSLVVTWLTK